MGNLLPLNISIDQGSADPEEACSCLDVDRMFEFGTVAVCRRVHRVSGGGGHTFSPGSSSLDPDHVRTIGRRPSDPHSSYKADWLWLKVSCRATALLVWTTREENDLPGIPVSYL